MRPHRTRAGLRLAAMATGLLTAGALLGGPPAAAATGSATQDPAALATSLTQRLALRTAGAYLDATTGKLVVTVTDAAAARTVREAGAVPRTVTRSGADLRAAMAQLDLSAKVTGTAWAADSVSDQVIVSVDQSVTGAKLAKVQAAAARLGSAVRLQRVSGTFSTLIRGGDAIFGGNSRCSLGFNVRTSAGTFYFLTAGHCGNIASTWYANSSHTTVLGSVADSRFPGDDFSIIRYTNTSISHPGTVNLYNGSSQDITQAGNAFVGQSVRRSGSTTGVHSGTVQALNQTVNYPQGTVFGLIQTSVCAEPGDSGGSLFAGTTALGLTSGGSGDCTFGGTTFFQPVTEPLNFYGVNVY